MTKPLSVQQFFQLSPDDTTCLDHLFRARFGEQVQCPKCNKVSKFYRLESELGALDGQGPLDGNVEADETYIGGHKPASEGGHNKLEKTVVFAMLDRETGEVISKVVPDSTGKTLTGEIEAHVVKGSTIHTDEWKGYAKLGEKGYEHSTVNHAAKGYARDGSHVNTLEAYFGILKRSIRSTHIWVSPKHMPKYLAEFEYRMNLRRAPDLMFRLMLSFERLVPRMTEPEPPPF